MIGTLFSTREARLYLYSKAIADILVSVHYMVTIVMTFEEDGALH